MIAPSDNAERLSDIVARVEKLVFTREQAPDSCAPVSAPSAHAEQALLPMGLSTAETISPPEYIQAEAFLEVSGYFTPSSKRIKDIYTKQKKLREYLDEQGKKRTISVEIIATHKFGLPITSDLDYYRAFLKICDDIVDREGRFRLPIAVPTKQLLRYAGKREGTIERREVKDWLKRLTLTGITGAVYRAKHKDYDDGFTSTVFSQVVVKGERLRNGRLADTNYVWLSPWFLSNYYYRYIRPIDFEFYKRLRKPIAKSLYTLLENGWYAARGKPYAKSYSTLCDEFLMKRYAHLSRIKQQLDPSHHELKREGFLAHWDYRLSVSGSDYILLYYPGQKFFADQGTKDTRRTLAEEIDARQSAVDYPQLDLLDQANGLLADILDICGDKKNTAAYLKIIKTHPNPLIRMALSETRQAQLEGRITKNRGAYFTDVLKRLVDYHATV